MAEYSYKTVAAPRKPRKTRGVRGAEALIAHAVGEIIQAEAANGWEYLRTDSIPVEEGGGVFSRAVTVWRAVMVFRRAVDAPSRNDAAAAPEFEPRDPDELREPFMRVATTTPASPGYQPPSIGGAKRE
ncbi:hypothetical protein G5B40_04305 [Pikeienuella piscinae]|uniref:DUF4177 domain-containing protein n=1 Tax=Pikeienuella piscinae TaxID=2748098 RepID=A0A7L5BU55_9RHOB|nr:hypothetical protein [Pikeienuella piscinae]QIE54731.1 hypothetical protein G5B40_04305 [Pikeienuella piscinae]